jgi:transmembrane sensor
MPDLEREIAGLREAIDPGWDPARSERLYAGLGQLRRRQAVRRAGVSGALAVAAVVALVVVLPRGEQPTAKLPVTMPSAPAVQAPAEHAATLHLSDGSTARLLEAGGELRVVHDEVARIELDLVRGRAHFEVVPNKEREFVVAAGLHRVVVVGTAFEVERTLDDRVRVQVERGRVRIEGPDARELDAGEERWLLNEVRDEAPRGDVAEAVEAVVTPKRRVEPQAPATPDWRSLVQSGDHDAAYAALGSVVVENDPWALMDAADAARLSGHPAEAIGYLDRVVRDHRQSPVAALAAFTVGRVQLERLGDPHAAAEAFVTARSLAPAGSLAQDALAREVEARSKAGDANTANARAREYLDKYPEGARTRAVRLFGGIE